MTAVRYAFDYLFGLGLFGFIYWILNGIKSVMQTTASLDSTTLPVYDLANLLWTGALVIYLIFGAFWLPKKIQEEWLYER